MNTENGLRSDEGSRLADAARNVADQAGQTVEAKASTTMNQVATTIDEVARAIRRAGDELRPEQPQIASVADNAADQVERAATYIESHEPREMLDTIQESARRQPALLIGAGIAVGLVLGRLLRTTLPSEGSNTSMYRTGGIPRNGGRYALTSAGNGGNQPARIGDPEPTILGSTRVVRPSSSVDTGSSRQSSG
jgi:ElaB/YqjD/DUF883 family membrane-anchored ribosome-binding protein